MSTTGRPRKQARNPRGGKIQFVVRTHDFMRVMNDIRTAGKGQSPQHYIWIGGPGSGKTTLLRRIKAEIAMDSGLSKHHLALMPPEEQAAILRLHDLWDLVADMLGERGFGHAATNDDELSEDLFERSRRAFNVVLKALRASRKRLVLLLDNIDRVLQNIGEEAALLREQLMNHPDIRIIGSCSDFPEVLGRYEYPFFQFFHVKRLEPLETEEVRRMLEQAAGKSKAVDEIWRTRLGLVETLRMLTDATPATFSGFAERIVKHPSMDAFGHLELCLDHSAPTFKERLRGLSPQQQKIVLETAFLWESATVEQLVPACRMPGKVISAQLNALVAKGTVEKLPGDKRSFHYRLVDRYFNLWLLATQGGARQRREVEFLVSFLEQVSILESGKSRDEKAQKLRDEAFGHLLTGDMESFLQLHDWALKQIFGQTYDLSFFYCMILMTAKQYNLARQLLAMPRWVDGLEKRLALRMLSGLENRHHPGGPPLPKELEDAKQAGIKEVMRMREQADIT